jgi:hypothetical protein
MCFASTHQEEPGHEPAIGLFDIIEGVYQVAAGVGIVAVFALTYWALESPVERL